MLTNLAGEIMEFDLPLVHFYKWVINEVTLEIEPEFEGLNYCCELMHSVGFQIAYIGWPKQDQPFKKCNTMQKGIKLEVRKLDYQCFKSI